MFGSIFYHNSIRKSVTVFGNMFEGIRIRRFDASKNVLQTIPVPIMYGRQSKIFALIQTPPEKRKVQIQLPVMSFIITGITPSGDRRTSPLNKNVKVLNNSVKTVQFAEVPYTIQFELSIAAKSYDDAAQIVEQIIPYFQPSFIPTVTMVPELDLAFDLKTTLTDLNLTDDFEGSADESGMVIWTLNFTMNSFFFGPVSTQGVIKRAIVDLIPVPGSGTISGQDIIDYGRAERITITPGLTEDGLPTSNSALTIPYSEINADDNYGFVNELESFTDGKKWNPINGEDE